MQKYSGNYAHLFSKNILRNFTTTFGPLCTAGIEHRQKSLLPHCFSVVTDPVVEVVMYIDNWHKTVQNRQKRLGLPIPNTHLYVGTFPSKHTSFHNFCTLWLRWGITRFTYSNMCHSYIEVAQSFFPCPYFRDTHYHFRNMDRDNYYLFSNSPSMMFSIALKISCMKRSATNGYWMKSFILWFLCEIIYMFQS